MLLLSAGEAREIRRGGEKLEWNFFFFFVFFLVCHELLPFFGDEGGVSVAPVVPVELVAD